MKILRALTRPQFAEFCNRNDHLNCEPGEIVVPTCTMCRHMESGLSVREVVPVTGELRKRWAWFRK